MSCHIHVLLYITSSCAISLPMSQLLSKANKTLGLIKRISRGITDFTARRLLYCTLVRPKLEYASNVWSPSAVKHRSLIENVQRRADEVHSKFEDEQRSSFYPKEMTYRERLITTNLLPLEFRREIVT